MANGDDQPTFAQIPQPNFSPPLSNLAAQARPFWPQVSPGTQPTSKQPEQGWGDWLSQRGNIIGQNVSRNWNDLTSSVSNYFTQPHPQNLSTIMNQASFLIGPRFFNPLQAEMFPLAQMAEMRGMPMEQIAREFGGIRRMGPSGKWGIEGADDPNVNFDVNAPQFEGMKPGEAREFRLGEHYQNDPFFRTYPQAQDMPVSLQRATDPREYFGMPEATYWGPQRGQPVGSMALKRFDPEMQYGKSDRLVTNLLDLLRGGRKATENVAHELGHFAQQANKFPGMSLRGTEPIDWSTPEGLAAYQNQAHEVQARMLEQGVGKSNQQLLESYLRRSTGGGQYPEAGQDIRGAWTADPHDVPLTPENMDPDSFDALMWKMGIK